MSRHYQTAVSRQESIAALSGADGNSDDESHFSPRGSIEDIDEKDRTKSGFFG